MSFVKGGRDSASWVLMVYMEEACSVDGFAAHGYCEQEINFCCKYIYTICHLPLQRDGRQVRLMFSGC